MDRPSPDRADIAVQSVLEVDAEAQAKYAGTILTAVRTWASTGLLEVDRRLHRDLEDLERTVDGTCGGWLEWSRRLEGETRWADASSVLRNQLTSWGPLNDLTAQQIEQVAESILNSVDGKNEDQLRSSLDVLLPHRINGNFQSRRQRFLPGPFSRFCPNRTTSASRFVLHTWISTPRCSSPDLLPTTIGISFIELRRCGCGLHRPMPLIGQ